MQMTYNDGNESRQMETNGFKGWFRRLSAPGTLRLWLLAALPLWAVLVLTGLLDPAQGSQGEQVAFMTYLPVSAVVVLFSMALNLVKGFFVLHFGRVDCGMLDSGRRLARIHGAMLLLEAVATLALFLLRRLAAYPMLEQLQLFGHELIYALALGCYLRQESEASLRRITVVTLLCFLLASAWLLLSVLTSLV